MYKNTYVDIQIGADIGMDVYRWIGIMTIDKDG